MALKRRQIAIILSVSYLGLLTILAAYASHSSSSYSLPIPNAQAALTLALPPIAGITIELSNALGTALASKPKHRQAAKSTIPPILLPGTLTLALLLIYETVMATLAGARIAPIPPITAALKAKWEAMYAARDDRHINRLQTRFKCCGFEGPGDMSLPRGEAVCMPDKHGVVAEVGCLEKWRGEQRLVAGIMLAVAVGVFIWMAVVTATPVAQPKVLRKVLQPASAALPGGEAEEHGGERYHDDEDADAEDDDDGDDDGLEQTSVRREINKLNSQSNIATLVESNRSRPSKLNAEAGRWESD